MCVASAFSGGGTSMRMAKLLAGCAAVLALSGVAWADDVTPDRLVNAGIDAEAGNWLMVGKSYNSNRFSPLKDFNAGNLAGRHVVTAAPLGWSEPGVYGVGSMQGTPLADNGFLYVSDPWGTPYKFDLSDGKTAKVVRVCDTGVEKDPTMARNVTNHGLALAGKLVITALRTGHGVACDGDSGDGVWDKQIGAEGEGFNAAPLVVGDKVLVSQAYGDWATRGYVVALKLDAADERSS